MCLASQKSRKDFSTFFTSTFFLLTKLRYTGISNSVTHHYPRMMACVYRIMKKYHLLRTCLVHRTKSMTAVIHDFLLLSRPHQPSHCSLAHAFPFDNQKSLQMLCFVFFASCIIFLNLSLLFRLTNLSKYVNCFFLY